MRSMSNPGERRANWACVRSAEYAATGSYPRDSRPFRIATTPGIRGVLVASDRVRHRYDFHRRHFPSDRVLFSIRI